MLQLIEDFNGTVSEQLYLVSATWGKLKADYPRDVAKIEDLVGSVVLRWAKLI